MKSIFFPTGHTRYRAKTLLIFSLIWVGGLVLGMAIGSSVPIVDASVSEKTVVSVLPHMAAGFAFLLMAGSVRVGARLLPLFLLSGQGLCRGYTGAYLISAFSSGAWLASAFVQFSGGILSVLMWWLLARNCFGRTTHKNDLIAAVILYLLVSIIDFTCISPFFDGLFNYY